MGGGANGTGTWSLAKAHRTYEKVAALAMAVVADASLLIQACLATDPSLLSH